jgi:homoserine kinase
VTATAHARSAFAPATVANVAVGFDILGFPVEGVGDRVTVEAIPGREVRIAAMSGEAAAELPRASSKNTATLGLERMIADLGLRHGFSVTIEKGIPLASGMGGSAASAVAGVVAANALLEKPLPKEDLLKYALAGESLASGAVHGDNVVPCLLGGLRVVRGVHEAVLDTIEVPIDEGVLCVLVHPHLRVATLEARKLLKPAVPMAEFVHQTANLATFVAACFEGDAGLMRRSLVDAVIEPQRQHLIQGFAEARRAALLHRETLGFSISGSGPSCFALVWGGRKGARARGAAVKIEQDIRAAFRSRDVTVESWISPVSREGARVLR